MKVKIADITVSPDRNPIVEKTVASLIGSIKDVGLLNAVTINHDMKLIAGAHRLEACKRLGWEEIEAHEVDLNELLAEMAEIDENLIRNDYRDYIDEGEKLLRRKEIYEILHPETKAGIAGGVASGVARGTTADTATVQSFNADVAQKTGMPERTLRKNIQIARDVTPEAKDEIRKVGLGKEKAIEVARAPKEQQVEKVRELAQKPTPTKEQRPQPALDLEAAMAKIPEPPPNLENKRHYFSQAEAMRNTKYTPETASGMAMGIIAAEAKRYTDNPDVLAKMVKEQATSFINNLCSILTLHSDSTLSPDNPEARQKIKAILSEAGMAQKKLEDAFL